MIHHQYTATIMYHCSKISTSSPSSRDWENLPDAGHLFYVELQAVRVRLTVTPPGGPKRKTNSSSNPEIMRPKKRPHNAGCDTRTGDLAGVIQDAHGSIECILLLRLMWLLQVLEEQATVGSKEGGEHKRLHGHELDEDVEGWAGGVLQGVTDGVTNHSSLMAV